MSTHEQNLEKLNLLGAALITAAAAHGLLGLASLPGLITAPAAGFLALATKAAMVMWCLAGIAAGATVAVHAGAFLGGRSLNKARRIAFAALALPIVGVGGFVTAFALLPIAGLALVLFRDPTWRSLFADSAVVQAAAEAIQLE